MLTQLQPWTRRSTSFVLLAALMVFVPPPAFAQNQEQSSFLTDTLKRVVFDPTTYAPAAVAYGATMRDWDSSQPFFRNGYLEHNERFTITGRPNDVPLSYGAGRSRILSDTLINLEMSLVNNAADQMFERILTARVPNRRTLVRTLGWIERISFASYMSNRLSAAHYRQASENNARAQQLGYR